MIDDSSVAAASDCCGASSSSSSLAISGVSCRLPGSSNIDEFAANLHASIDMTMRISGREAHKMDPQLRMLLEVSYEALVDAGYTAIGQGERVGVFVGASFSDAHRLHSRCQNPSQYITGQEMTGGGALTMLANRLSYSFNFTGPSHVVDAACSSSLLALDLAMQSILLGRCDAALVCGSNLILDPLGTLQFQKLGMVTDLSQCRTFDKDANGYCRADGIVAIFLQKTKDAKRVYLHPIASATNCDGYKSEGITCPSSELQQMLFKRLYFEAGIDPEQINYIEAHGTGTQKGDSIEMESISGFFVPKHSARTKPLLIGSTKSNMGHSESCSGLASLCKLIIAVRDRRIPPNLHYEVPNPKIPELGDPRIQIVDKPTTLPDGLIALNNFGFGGANVHVIFDQPSRSEAQLNNTDSKTINNVINSSNFPKLFVHCGRTQSSIEKFLNSAAENRNNSEYLSLLSETAEIDSYKNLYRGYTIISDSKSESSSIKSLKELTKRPEIVFCFSGMGVQWPGMAQNLYRECPEFAQAINESHEFLKSAVDFDLISILLHRGTFTNVLESMLSNVSVQIALFYVLSSKFGIKPDKVIGHSVGETLCPFALGIQSTEETLLAVYHRAKVLLDAQSKGLLVEGKMFAALCDYEQMLELISEFKEHSESMLNFKTNSNRQIQVAALNSPGSLTITGDTKSIDAFSRFLGDRKIKTRDVDSSGIPFHSSLLDRIAEELEQKLLEIIPDRRMKPRNWISTSKTAEKSPSDISNTECVEYFNGSYHANNFKSMVQFCNAATQNISEKAVIFEIAPQALLTSQLIKCIGNEATYIRPMQKPHDTMIGLLTAVGNAFNAGLKIDSNALLANVEHPIVSAMPFISPLVDWKHTDKWEVPKYTPANANCGGGSSFSYKIDLSDPQWSFLSGHVIDGRIIFPATGYLYLALKSFRNMMSEKSKKKNQVAFEFSNVTFHAATIFEDVGDQDDENRAECELFVSILPISGEFLIFQSGQNLVCSGAINSTTSSHFDAKFAALEETSNAIASPHDPTSNQLASDVESLDVLDRASIYSAFNLRGYNYSGSFAQLSQHNSLKSQTTIELKATANSRPGSSAVNTDPVIHSLDDIQLIPLMDMMLQCSLLHTSKRQLLLPSKIRNVIISLDALNSQQSPSSDEVCEFNSKFNKNNQSVWTDVAIIQGLKCTATTSSASNPLQTPDQPIYQSNRLVELKNGNLESLKHVLELIFRLLQTKIQLGDSRHTLKIVICSNDDYIQSSETSDFENDTLSQTIRSVQSQCFPLMEIAIENVSETDNECPTGDLIIVSGRVPKFAALLQGDEHLLLLDIKPALSDMIIPDHISLISGYFNNYGATKSYSFSKIADLKSQANNCDEKLLRKNVIDFKINQDLLYQFQWVDDLRNAINSITSADHDDNDEMANIPQILIIHLTFGFENKPGKSINLHHPLIGFFNCLIKEYSTKNIGLRLVVGDVEVDSIRDLVSCGTLFSFFGQSRETLKTICHLTTDLKPVYSEEMNHSDCTECVYLDTVKRGDLTSLKWHQSKLSSIIYGSSTTAATNELLCKVKYAPLNFRDVMIATGRIPPEALPGDTHLADTLLGLEFSGHIYDVEKRSELLHRPVMGILDYGALATFVRTKESFVWAVPEAWSLEEAATVPVAYLTSYYALVCRGNIREGKSILIHSAAGAVGLASLRICLSRKLTVFVSVGTDEKREFLHNHFKLPQENILNSRSDNFEYQLLNLTNGRGVDYVLNSTSGSILKASVRCVAKGGHFLEIGKFDLSKDSNLGMSFFLRNVTFHGILLDALFSRENNDDWIKLSKIMNEGLKSGEVQPLPLKTFKSTECQKAFQMMTKGQHIGKLVLDFSLPPRSETSSNFRLLMPDNSSCLIVGGLGAIGLEVSNWLVENGCRQLFLTSRRGLTTAKQKRYVECWQNDYQAEIHILANVMDSPKKVKTLIDEIKLQDSRLGTKLFGAFFLSAVLDDNLFKNLSIGSFLNNYRAKALPAVLFDKLARQSQDFSELKHFVCFSSISSGFGNAGQSNYGFSNAALESLVAERRMNNYPAICIQLGAIGQVGMFAELEKKVSRDAILKNLGGVYPQSIASLLSSLTQMLNTSGSFHDILSCQVLKSFDGERNKNKKGDVSGESLLDQIVSILGFSDIQTIPSSSTLTELGLYSFGLIEVKNKLEKFEGKDFTTEQVGNMTFDQLQKILKKSREESKADENLAISGEEEKDLLEKFKALKYVRINHFERKHWVTSELICEMQTAIDLPENNLSHSKLQNEKIFLLFSPIEGTIEKLKPLALLLKGKAFGVNFLPDIPLGTIEEFAKKIIDDLLKLLPNEPLTIVPIGYSYGASIALQVAHTLNSHEYAERINISKLILIDGSQDYVKILMKMYLNTTDLSKLDKPYLESNILLAFILQFADCELRQMLEILTDILKNTKSHVATTKLILSHFFKQHPKADRNDVEFDIEGLYQAYQMFNKRMKMAIAYSPEIKLQRIDVLLFRSTLDVWKALQDTNIYLNVDNLLSQGKEQINVIKLDGNHTSIVQNESIIETIAKEIERFSN